MITPNFNVYSELNPNKKDGVWADNTIRILRRDWRYIVDLSTCFENKRYLESRQDMSKVIEMFKDKKFKENTRFDPLGIMFSIINTIVEELRLNPPKTEVRAVDPSAVNAKQKDLQLLKARGILEGDISNQNAKVGLPPHKMDYKSFKGNVKDFDDKGLNPNDSDDLGFYADNFQRLNSEIALQQLVNNVNKTNKFDEDKIKKAAMDMVANNVICFQNYVDKITGEIKQKYLYPEIVKGIFGDASDGYNDICSGWEDSLSIMEWMQMVGNEFDWNRDWPKLIWALNYKNGWKYTGFRRGGLDYDSFGNGTLEKQLGFTPEKSNLVDWNTAYTYQVYVGYIEWKSIDATATYLFKKGAATYEMEVDYDYDLRKKKQVKEYEKQSWYQEQMYSSYYMATSSTSQWIFGFGKVYHQQLEGANDEYARGTMRCYRQEGRTAVEIAKPYINMANKAFYKMMWIIDKAKPEDDVYVLEELIQVSKGLQKMYPQSSTNSAAAGFQNILNQAIQYQKKILFAYEAIPK